MDLINSQSRIKITPQKNHKIQNSKFNNPISNNKIENKY
jgi:hypothetical protein